MATIIWEKKVKPITPKVETQTHDEKSFMEIIQSEEFDFYINDYIERIVHKASDLPASIRSAIVELFTSSISKVLKDRIIKKQKEEHGKEEGGSESANG